MSAFNNNNPNLNNTSAGIEGRGSNLASQGTDNLGDINRRQPGELNENHGIAATGLNEPHTHTNIPSTRGNELNYTGAPIADTRKIDQQAAYGNTAGHDLNSHSNRTGGTGIPPVNTAEHVRRNAAEEAIASGHHGAHHTGNNDISHERDLHHNAGTGSAATTGATTLGNNGAPHNSHAGVGLDDKARIASHNTANVTHRHHPDDPVSVGAPTTAGKHQSGTPLSAGHPNKDLKHSTDQHHNEKYGNLSHKEDNVKVSASDKIKGNLEKIAGKITGNEAKVIQGENLAQGRSI